MTRHCGGRPESPSGPPALRSPRYIAETPAAYAAGVTITGQITADDPHAPDVRALLERHLTFALATTPPEHAFALDADKLADPQITFFGCRAPGGELLGIGALKEHSPVFGEIKSMHTAAAARGRGVGRAMLTHLLDLAAERGYARVSLETGTMAEFAAARALYTSAGFTPCPPFGDYKASPDNCFMTLRLPPRSGALD